MSGTLRTQTGSVAQQSSSQLHSNIQSLAWHSKTLDIFILGFIQWHSVMITQKGISPPCGCMAVIGTEITWADIFVFRMVVQQRYEQTKPNFCLVAATCGGPKRASLPSGSHVVSHIKYSWVSVLCDSSTALSEHQGCWWRVLACGQGLIIDLASSPYLTME